MTYEEFETLVRSEKLPDDLPPPLLALLYDARGDWHAAHHVAQDIGSKAGSWIHAYLHRKEGDLSNAGYWYRRAQKPEARDTLDVEWERIVTALLTPQRDSV